MLKYNILRYTIQKLYVGIQPAVHRSFVFINTERVQSNFEVFHRRWTTEYKSCQTLCGLWFLTYTHLTQNKKEKLSSNTNKNKGKLKRSWKLNIYLSFVLFGQKHCSTYFWKEYKIDVANRNFKICCTGFFSYICPRMRSYLRISWDIYTFGCWKNGVWFCSVHVSRHILLSKFITSWWTQFPAHVV